MLRPRLWLVAGVGVLLVPMLGKLRGVAHAPIINDISTDLEDPPAYPSGRHGPLPASFKPKIAAAYPDLQPVVVAPPAAGGDAAARGPQQQLVQEVLDRVVVLVRETPLWELEAVVGGGEAAAPAAGGDAVVEGVATTRLLRFKDDFVVRLRLVAGDGVGAAAAGAGAGGGWGVRVDMRSASRVGKGDLGTNAARIRGFLQRLREDLAGRGLRVLG